MSGRENAAQLLVLGFTFHDTMVKTSGGLRRALVAFRPPSSPCLQHSCRGDFHTSTRSQAMRSLSKAQSQARSPIASNGFTSRLREAVVNTRKQYPVLFPTLLIATFGAVSMLSLMAYDELTRVAPEYAAFPTPVEQRLRLALHFTHIQPDPDVASKYFMEAIEAAEEIGMESFSKEVMGIRIRLAEMLEKFGRVRASIEVLNSITKDYEEQLVQLDQSPDQGSKSERPSDDELDRANARKAALHSIIQMKVKISSLYESDYIQDPTMEKQTLSDAVGLMVKETKDPQLNGFSEENGAGLSLGEIAAILSQMGDLYATTGEEANAVQVYMLTLQPLRASCNGTKSCKEVQILSNIASTMDLALKKPDAKINGKPATKESLAAARRATLKWADQAIATAEVVTPEDRDEICELGLLSAQMTRADLLLESGDKVRSREAFIGLLPTLREKNLAPLIDVAEQGLKKANA